MDKATKQKAAIGMIKAIADTIRELGEAPAGTMYAAVMQYIGLTDFECIVGILVNAGLVERDSSHMLRWVGPR